MEPIEWYSVAIWAFLSLVSSLNKKIDKSYAQFITIASALPEHVGSSIESNGADPFEEYPNGDEYSPEG